MKEIVFSLIRGDVYVDDSILRDHLETLLDAYIKKTPQTTNIDSTKVELEKVLAQPLDQQHIPRVQIMGTANFVAYVDVHIYQPEEVPTIISNNKDLTKEANQSVVSCLEKLWREYNDKLSVIYQRGTLPKSDVSRGYSWYAESFMQDIQREVVQFVSEHVDELIQVSNKATSPTSRGIANFFLRFIPDMRGLDVLLKNTEDSDHFSHNMAWQSIGSMLKIISDPSLLDKIKNKAIQLLYHPSSLCINKGLATLEFFAEQKTLLPLDDKTTKIIKELTLKKNPAISDSARLIMSFIDLIKSR